MVDVRFNTIDAQGLRGKQIAALGSIVAFALTALLRSHDVHAAEVWGGSLGATSDYLVRGISRSNNDPAAQADVHFATDGGFIAGMFASSTQLSPYDRRDAELGALAGFVLQPGGAWRAKLTASYYSYPWNEEGSRYNYAEFLIEATYNDWLDLEVAFAPRAHYLPDQSLEGVSATTAEIALRTPWRHRLALTTGAGHTEFTGSPSGYNYWSAAGMVDLAPWLLTVGYIDTNSQAKALFYDAAAHDRWTATVIWRF